MLQLQAEPAVQIAIDRRTGADRRRHPVGRDAAPFNRIDVRAVGTDADTVARSERGVAVERKASDIARGHPPYELAHRLGRVERRDTRRPPHKEILRFAARETLRRIGGEIEPRLPHRRTAAVAARSDRLVEPAAVVGHHVADIAFVFEPSFDLERGDARVDQRPQPIGQIEIAHREQVLAAQNPPSGGVFQIVAQTARLAAFAPIAAARRHRPRQITLTAVPHADRTVDETLDLGCRGAADRTDLVERQRPFQNHACETRIPQKRRLGRRADRRLRRGVQFDGSDMRRSAMSCTMSASTPAATSSRACRSAAASSSS